MGSGAGLVESLVESVFVIGSERRVDLVVTWRIAK